jgi:dephospho-CoA kinase
MIVLGLTGSIGMGKTEAARAFSFLGYPVFEADASVHRLLAEDSEVIVEVETAFPDCVQDGTVDRACLAAVFDDEEGGESLDRLESILHPRVRAEEERFLAMAEREGAALAVLEAPLLFETGADALCDAVAVASAPEDVQAARVLSRPGMTHKRLAVIRARQMPDADKRAQAAYVIETSAGYPKMLRQVSEIANILWQSAPEPE